MGAEVRITYETLFDLVRREKARDELQKLDPSFFADAEAYLTEKHSIASGPNESFFSDEERQKTILQLANSCKLIRELYERREKKILSMAMIKARQERALLDTAAQLSVEKEFFEQAVQLLRDQRAKLLEPMMTIGGKASRAQSVPQPPAEQKAQPLKKPDEPESISVEFLADVPKFVGKTLEIYGPYISGQSAILPKDIARILIEKGRVKVQDPPRDLEPAEQIGEHEVS
ncbi:MAG TPA: hypothetical protein VJK52_05610 [Candidatus Nanoarchaeia archaeon]|nr:hypothetical protein [Candidatus Nanoarchaeia archaeon]